MERDCESKLSKLNIEQNACIYHFGASVIHGQRSNILRLHIISAGRIMLVKKVSGFLFDKSKQRPAIVKVSLYLLTFDFIFFFLSFFNHG